MTTNGKVQHVTRFLAALIWALVIASVVCTYEATTDLRWAQWGSIWMGAAFLLIPILFVLRGLR